MKRKDQWKEYYKNKLENTVLDLMGLLKNTDTTYMRRQSGYKSRWQIKVILREEELRQKIKRLQNKIGGDND